MHRQTAASHQISRIASAFALFVAIIILSCPTVWAKTRLHAQRRADHNSGVEQVADQADKVAMTTSTWPAIPLVPNPTMSNAIIGCQCEGTQTGYLLSPVECQSQYHVLEMTFTDPIPRGNVVTGAKVTVWAAGYSIRPYTLEVVFASVSLGKRQGNNYLDNNCNAFGSPPPYCTPLDFTATMRNGCGLPGYVYRGTNRVFVDWKVPGGNCLDNLFVYKAQIELQYELPSKICTVEIAPLNVTLDANPNPGGGRRIFPDKTSPTDTADRSRVRITARTSLGKNKKVYFRSFDLDDPSDDPDVDTNGPAGTDNFGTPQVGTLIGQGTTGASTWAYTDVSGTAFVDLAVTKQPGNNFMVAASEDSAYLNSNQLQPSGVGLVYGSTPLPNDKANVSEMLTVWRYAYIEVDSMQGVPNFENSTTGRITTATPVDLDTALEVTLVSVAREVHAGALAGGSLAVGARQIFIESNQATVADGSGTFGLVLRIALQDGLTQAQITQLVSELVDQWCYLFDDDDYNSSESFDPETKTCTRHGDEGELLRGVILQMVQQADDQAINPFARAYVVPKLNQTGNSPEGTAPFVLNSRTDNDAALRQEYTSFSGIGAMRGNDYWWIFIRSGYQPRLNDDGDHSGAEVIAFDTDGVGNAGRGGTAFLETKREVERALIDLLTRNQIPTDWITDGRFEAREIARMVALLLGCEGNEGGLSDASTAVTSSDYYQLSGAACRKIRNLRFP